MTIQSLPLIVLDLLTLNCLKNISNYYYQNVRFTRLEMLDLHHPQLLVQSNPLKIAG